MSEKKRIFYVLSLAHSGSTIFALALAKAFGGMAIGESHEVMAGSTDDTEGMGEICSCGKPLAQCPYWGPFISQNVTEIGKAPWNVLYANLLAQPVPEGIDLLVDSSKKAKFIPVLKDMRKEGRADPFVVFLVRDARGWVLSDRSAWARRKDPKKFTLLRHFWSWARGNDEFQRALRESGLPFVTIGYEEFCFDQEKAFDRIANASGWQRSSSPWAHHVAHSNRSKMGKDTIVYDARWMKSWKVNALFSLIPGLAKKNAAWVYGD